MTNDIRNHRDQIKAIGVNTPGTPTQKLLAIYAAAGITDTAELVEITGLTPRAIQIAKRNGVRQSETDFAKPISHEAKPVSPEAKPISPPKKVSPTPPSKNTTPITNTVSPSAVREDGRTDDFAECKSALNGSTEALLTIIEAAMGGHCRKNAVHWLANLCRINGQRAVAEAYQRWLTAQAENQIIARPLPWLDKTAKSCRTEAAKPAASEAPDFAKMTAGVVRHAKAAPRPSTFQYEAPGNA